MSPCHGDDPGSKFVRKDANGRNSRPGRLSLTGGALPSLKADGTDNTVKEEEENADIHRYEWRLQACIKRIEKAKFVDEDKLLIRAT